MALQLSVFTKEYVRLRVSATDNGVVVNPTADTVQMAFLAGGVQPQSGDWKAASWETDASTDPDTYFARCLVAGASAPSSAGAAITLGTGLYAVWLRVTDNPEAPIRRIGTVEVIP